MADQSETIDKSNRLASYAAVSTSVLTVVTFAIAYLTAPLAGPYCKGACFQYPYTDIISRFPRDYFWMYPALILLAVYGALMACIHHCAPKEKKGFSLVGLFFALMSATILISDYFIQLSVIQPSLLNGETDGIALLTQFNPHGIFIALEDLGYLAMSLAFLFMAPVFSGSRLEKSVRWIFIAAFVLTMASFIGYSIFYGVNREYRFEVTAISINWLTLIASGILLGFIFKRRT
jgi:hypothetical protein